MSKTTGATAASLEKRLVKLERTLKRPRSIRELKKLVGGSDYSIYRWIRLLTAKGVTVVRVPGREGVFQVLP